MTVSPERIEEALAIADRVQRWAGPEGQALRSLAAALREAQAENERLRETEKQLKQERDLLFARVARAEADNHRLAEYLRGIRDCNDPSLGERALKETVAIMRQKARAALAPAGEAKR